MVSDVGTEDVCCCSVLEEVDSTGVLVEEGCGSDELVTSSVAVAVAVAVGVAEEVSCRVDVSASVVLLVKDSSSVLVAPTVVESSLFDVIVVLGTFSVLEVEVASGSFAVVGVSRWDVLVCVSLSVTVVVRSLRSVAVVSADDI